MCACVRIFSRCFPGPACNKISTLCANKKGGTDEFLKQNQAKRNKQTKKKNACTSLTSQADYKEILTRHLKKEEQKKKNVSLRPWRCPHSDQRSLPPVWKQCKAILASSSFQNTVQKRSYKSNHCGRQLSRLVVYLYFLLFLLLFYFFF